MSQLRTHICITTFLVLGAMLATGCRNGAQDVGINDSLSELKQNVKQYSVYRIKRDHTYVDLNTGKRLELEIDTLSKRVIDKITRYPVLHFIDITDNDTLDENGRVINSAIKRNADGTWYVDEEKLGNIKKSSD